MDGLASGALFMTVLCLTYTNLVFAVQFDRYVRSINRALNMSLLTLRVSSGFSPFNLTFSGQNLPV